MGSALTTIGLPVALGIIMFGLGLSLTLADFARVRKQPKAVIIALALPAHPAARHLLRPRARVPAAAGPRGRHDAARGLAGRHDGEPLQPPVPRRRRAQHLAHGGQLGASRSSRCRSSPTSRSGTSCPFDDQLGLQWAKVVEVFAIVLLPVALGMLVRRFWPAFAEAHGQAGAHRLGRHPRGRHRRRGRLELDAARRELRAPRRHHDRVLPDQPHASATSCRGCSGSSRRQAIASSFEIGIHNATLAIVIAQTVLGSDRAEPARRGLRRADVLHRVRVRVPDPRARRCCRRRAATPTSTARREAATP